MVKNGVSLEWAEHYENVLAFWNKLKTIGRDKMTDEGKNEFDKMEQWLLENKNRYCEFIR